MKIAIATPLYPPDIAPPALFAKELARRMAPHHEVSLLAYTYIPEEIPGVSIISVFKRHPLPLRLFFFTSALWKVMREVDHVYVVNGPSVELPLLLVSSLTRTPYTLCRIDWPAYERTQKRDFEKAVHAVVAKRAAQVIDSAPLPRPEILPFGNPPTAELAAYEASWQQYVEILTTHL